jgi:hypothetical protein
MNPTDFSELPLRDIHLPGAVGWWPPAPGWWALVALLLAGAVAYGIYYYLARHRRVAVRAVRRVVAALEQGAEPVACLQNVSTVLRRFAMTTVAPGRAGAPPPDVPGLIGEPWLKYLDSRWARAGFASASGRRLLAAPYARPNSIERGAALELTALCLEWLSSQPVRPRAAAKEA